MELLSQEPIANIVARVWTNWIGLPQEWTREQQQEHLAKETARIETLIDDAIPGQGHLVTSYQREHGTSPDYPTTVRMINQARAQVREVVLTQELYSLIPDSEEEEIETDPLVIARQQSAEEEALRHSHRNDPDRWKKLLRSSEPTPEIEALSQKLWGDQSAYLRVFGERLLQARQEDGQRLPQSQTDPLFPAFTNQLDQALIDKGQHHATFRPPMDRS